MSTIRSNSSNSDWLDSFKSRNQAAPAIMAKMAANESAQIKDCVIENLAQDKAASCAVVNNYTAQWGDTLTTIVDRFLGVNTGNKQTPTDVANLIFDPSFLKENNIQNPNEIPAGKDLKLRAVVAAKDFPRIVQLADSASTNPAAGKPE